jgi:hypothetical protein
MQHSKILAVAFLAATTIHLSSCGNADNDNNNGEAENQQSSSISIAPVENSPQYPDAALTIKEVNTEMQGTDSVKVTIDYGVANYALKQQTSDASDKACNNSKDGQHIHFILDNAPYVALYEPTHSFVVPVNSSHYVMSFLSRSYHESVKSPNAGILYHFSIDGKGKLTKLANPETPMIFYSRPKGEYLGDDTKNLLLDFYVYNTTLSPDGNKVKATINGTAFTIDQWQPYFIQNAPMGDLTVQVQLLDQNGTALSGDNTAVSRTVKLAESEPIK